MRSSIFSSNRKWLILAGLVIVQFICHSILVRQLDITSAKSESQWSSNKIRFESYYYGPSYENVIVGTSMSARMKSVDLGNRFYNLSAAGGSSIEGLLLISEKDEKPKRVYVETNLLYKGLDERTAIHLANGFSMSLKKYFPVLLEKNKPTNLVLHSIRYLLRQANVTPPIATFSEDIFSREMSRHLQRNAVPEAFVSEDEGQTLVVLAGIISELQNSGVELVFYRMPVDEKIARSPRYKAMEVFLNQFKTQFVNSLFELPAPNDVTYQTTDGIHLLPEFARKFSKCLSNTAIEAAADIRTGC